jgi:hypothetical protein
MNISPLERFSGLRHLYPVKTITFEKIVLDGEKYDFVILQIVEALWQSSID